MEERFQGAFDDALEKTKRRSPFLLELTGLINRHSLENDSDTPDYILASYLLGCLEVFERTTEAREAWYGRKTTAANNFSQPPENPSDQVAEQVINDPNGGR